MGSPEEVGREPMIEWTLVMGSGRMWAPGSGSSLGGGTCVAGPWRRGWRSRSPRPSSGVHWRPATLILMGALMSRHPFQSRRDRVGRGLGQRPISSLCSCLSVPKPFQVPSPLLLGLCLRSSHLPLSLCQCQPPPPGAQLTCSLSSSWGLSASIPWRAETDGGGVAGIWRRAGTLSS